MNNSFGIAIFSFILIISLSVRGTEIASFEWAPFSGKYYFGEGLHDTIVKKAFEAIGIKVNIKHYPWSRAYKLALEGKVLLMSASDTRERREIFYYSKKYYSADSYLIGREKNKIDYKGKVGSLKEYKVGIIRGHYLINLFKKHGVDQIDQSINDEMNILKLYNGSVDFVAMSKMPMLFLLKESKRFIDKDIKVIFYEPPLRMNPVHLIVLKKMDSSKAYIKGFNKGLEKIKKDKTYHKILDRLKNMPSYESD